MTNQTNALAIPDQLDALRGEANEAFNNVAYFVNAMETEANPEQRLALANDAQQWLAYGNAQLEALAAFAGAQTDMINAVAEQRDAVAQELAELTEALDNLDAEHPLVGAAIETVEEFVSEQMMYGAEEMAWDGVFDEMTSSLMYQLGLSSADATALFEALKEGTVLTDVQIDRLIAYLEGMKVGEADPDEDDDAA